MLGGRVRIDEATENPFCRSTEEQKWFTFEAQRKKQIQSRKRRAEIADRIGRTKYYEVLGRLVHNAYPEGAIFDINSGELVYFLERPGLFIRIAMNQADREKEDWLKRRIDSQ